MNITSAILFSFLEQDHAVAEKNLSSGEILIDHVRFYRGGKIEPNHLYLMDGALPLPKRKEAASACFAFYGVSTIEKHHAGDTLDFIVLPEIADAQRLFEAISDVLGTLQKWDCTLKDALQESVSLDTFMRLGAQVFTQPYGLMDRNLSIVFLSAPIHGLEVESHDDILTPIAANEFLMDEEFHASSQNTEPYVYPIDDPYHQYLCINIFSGNQYVARGLFPANRTTGYDMGQTQLFIYFFEYVKAIYLRYADDPLIKHPTDRLHTLFRTLLLEAHPPGDIGVIETLREYGWKIGHEYSIVKLSFFKHTKWDEITSYICSQLEITYPHSCALRSGEDIIWIFNHSLDKSKTQNREFFHSLAYIVRDFVCRAGVSDTFSDFDQLRSYLLQAEIALKIGQKKVPNSWYFKFKDFILDYMSEQILQDFSKEQICHKGLKTLMAYDQTNNTEYCKTLKQYLLCAFNATHTAEKLFIHRTTLIRRLERIEQIAEIRFDAIEEQIHLILSFWIMEDI